MLASALAIWALVIPFQTILPAYAPPRSLAESELAHVPNPMQAHFGDEFELVGYRLAHDTVTRGEPLPLTLYWHVLKPTTNDYAVEVRLTDATSTVVGSVEHYPANGNYATSLWKRGDIIPDEYLVPLSANIGEPSGGKVVVSAYLSNGKTETPLKVMRAEKLGSVRMTEGLAAIWRVFELNSFRFILINRWCGAQVVCSSILLGSYAPMMGWLVWNQHWGLAVLFGLVPAIFLRRWYGNIISSFFSPIAIYIFQGIAIFAMLSTMHGRGVLWKGRRV